MSDYKQNKEVSQNPVINVGLNIQPGIGQYDPDMSFKDNHTRTLCQYWQYNIKWPGFCFGTDGIIHDDRQYIVNGNMVIPGRMINRVKKGGEK